jgi:hypothetical protein
MIHRKRNQEDWAGGNSVAAGQDRRASLNSKAWVAQS